MGVAGGDWRTEIRRGAVAALAVLALVLIAARPADARQAYVASYDAESVSVIDTETNATVGAPIAVGQRPVAITTTPDQAPVASFLASPHKPGSATAFNATGSSDADGSIARYDWDFGDGTTLDDAGPTPSHTYSAPGPHTVTLTLTDDEGCSSASIFTGQTAYCNSTGSARVSKNVVPDTSAMVEIKGGKLELDKMGNGKIELTCPDDEASPPCEGKLKLKSVKKLALKPGAKKRVLTLAKASFSLGAGETTKVGIKLSGSSLRLVRAQPAARKVKATATVSDAAGNSGNATAKLKLKL
jgi:YVTN family beta-propeller protein